MTKYVIDESRLISIADAIRNKTGTVAALTLDQMPSEIENIPTSASTDAVPTKEVNFYDYDGTCLYAYTVEEAQALTELPALPKREGLICQGWNYDLETIKTYNRGMNIGANYTTDDGTTRIYIHLREGRTSPMLGVCPNGTVIVDWGDETTTDVLTGTSVTTVKWTPTHNYTKPGDYVITLTVDGEMGFSGMNANGQYAYVLRHNASSDNTNCAYHDAVRRVECGSGVTNIGNSAFQGCSYLTSVAITDSVTILGEYAFQNCYFLPSITIPDGVTSLGVNVFSNCNSLISIAIPDSVTSICNSALRSCYSLKSITIPDGVTSIDSSAFNGDRLLTSVTIPYSVTSIGGWVFQYCYGVAFYDFTKHTTVPTLSGGSSFSPTANFEIRVPAALVDEWKAATNWTSYAKYIVGV